ncbi:anti-sigma factor family protein [Paractinoplanes abujensis]|uniref:RNA polymerase sigma-70 factor (ECF subfamily) n=1 Tax=Paractinoplanes abujensis TaxID=882441 RepID=A0A7W7CMR5_9ACTN|nr:zf-HC2 domain-containing protein [Actinoplanes abujensis]MBB4691422.1 RNA polymerase sigma-70 factor (ECF subfamily) [Actinoplanes abujensis]
MRRDDHPAGGVVTTPETGDHVDLAGYLVGELTPGQRAEADRHLAGCAECRAEVESLGEWTSRLRAVPAEMLLEGPPDGGDLLLQRTLREVRKQSSGERNRRTVLVSAAAAVLVAVAIGGGVLAGRSTAPEAPVAQAPPPLATSPTSVPGTRTGTAVDATTGARITVAVAPAAGWVRVNAAVAGIPAGEKCVLEVVARDGFAVQAGSWVVSEAGEAGGTTLNGSALIDPAQVASVRVVNTAGKQFASVDV